MTGLAWIWIGGFALATVWAVRNAGARATGSVGRIEPALTALAIAALAAIGAYGWGVEPARRGLDAITSPAGSGEPGTSPARARLFLHRVRAPLPSALRVGYSVDAGLRLPRGYGLAEEGHGWDLLALSATDDGGLVAALTVQPEASTTRILLTAAKVAGDAQVEDHARAARSLLTGGQCAVPVIPRGLAIADRASAVVAVLCQGDEPVAALVFERAGAAAAVTPLVWRGGRFRPHHVQLASGSLLQIGSLVDAVPGVELWEVPAPAGRAELVFPPVNLLTGCDEWTRAIVGSNARPASSGASSPGSSVCVLPFSPPFGLEVRRLSPDVRGVTARSAWAVGVVIGPALLLLMAMTVRRRSQLSRSALAPALALAWVSSLLAAIAVIRLLWSHRIDMLRDYEIVGWRVVHNEVTIALIGAALAATAALLATAGRRLRVQIPIAIAVWAAYAVAAGQALAGDLALAPRTESALGQAVLSLLIGLAPLGVRAWSRLDLADGARRAIGLLVAITAIALTARVFTPSAVALKLALAWSAVIASYGALRACSLRSVGSPDGTLGGIAVAPALAASLAAGGACAILDPGIAAAVVCPGLALAAVMAAHDARFADAALVRVATYRLDHAPVALAQAAIAFAAGLVLAAFAAAALWRSAAVETDATWSLSLTNASLHLLLLIALLVAPAAVVALRRRGLASALPWLVLCAATAAAWLARDAIARRVMESSAQAAHRLAIVLEPGHALLRDDARFLAGLTAWRETALPAGASAAEGQGYFGAQLIDPGVLLSVDNDYLPVLILREAGAAGVLAVAVAMLVFIAGLWLIAGKRFHHGSGAQRRRALAAAVLGVLAVYQPLAALGALPLTGVAWPGLGLDSPSDTWIFVALAAWIALWGTRPAGEGPLDGYDAELRAERRFRRLRWAIGAATLALTAGALLALTRTAVFAARRPAPVRADGEPVAPFDRLTRAVEYAKGMACGDHAPESAEPAKVVPVALIGRPTSDVTARFHAGATRAWLLARPAIVRELAAMAEGDAGACRGGSGALSFERTGSTCRVALDLGWPVAALTIRLEDAVLHATCQVELSPAPLRALRLPAARPYQDARIRLVSRAMGVAATDRGELVSGHLTVRLRGGAGELAGDRLDAGLFAADRVAIGDDISIEVRGDRVVLVRKPSPPADGPADRSWLFLRGPPESVHVVSAEAETWRREPSDRRETELGATALLVVEGESARSLWLFRPASSWNDAEPAPVVNPLVADDSWTVRGERRRFYVYGGLIPEVGWVNRFRERGSMGLDGWVRVATSAYAADAAPEAAGCGSLRPPRVDMERICAPSRNDGVLECRISIQPELAIRLGHLTELIALDPTAFAPDRAERWTLPVRASYALIRGDTGEIVAQSAFVPGRESSVYAPATPELEQRLIRLREDRDPLTGQKQPPDRRGESSAEKVDWNSPIAVGSTIKPVLARSLELADPSFTAALSLEGARFSGAECGDRGAHAVLGHCPPTDSLWNREGRATMADFLSYSANWFQAAIGLYGTAVPHGQWGFGEELTPPDPLVLRNVGDHQADAPLWTTYRGREVISRSRKVRVQPLRETAMWSRFEQLIGRPLCTLGTKRACERAAQRADLCAARALTIEDPTPDLRHLVSLGPDRYDFYPELADPDRALTAISTREYLQFLRGSGLHPIGSLPQLADVFNRLVYDRAPAPGAGYALAASWFPSPATGRAPRESCQWSGAGTTVRDGLCRAIHDGTARALSPLLSEDGVILYAAKTGTIDSLADVAESRAGCKTFNDGHTVPDRGAKPAAQPYWLGCGPRQSPVDDSLLLVSFGVVDHAGTVVPLTLALHFQRSGAGLATFVARHYVDVIRDYFSPGGRRAR